MGAHAGSLGAVRFDPKKALVLVDASLADRRDMVTGANEDGFHLRGVEVRRDLLASGASLTDLRTVKAGEGCPRCDGVLDVYKALEIGHIFKLGTKYSASMQATVLDASGKQVPIVMGSYGIGVERILAAAIELHHDDNGISWPMAIAPFQAAVLALGPEKEIKEAADALVQALSDAGVEVLYDDRDERAGVKFKDADLIGIPLRLSIGKRGLAGGNAEWKLREGGAVELVPLAEVAERAAALVKAKTASNQA
jgi:prolyl-tRNA synthetase